VSLFFHPRSVPASITEFLYAKTYPLLRVKTSACGRPSPASVEAQRQVDPTVAKQLPDLDDFTRDLDPVEGIQKRAV
jgi:hypothetical protein